MIQKSFHRIFTGSRAFTRRPRRPRRQLPRFSSLVLHVFARGVLPDHDSRPRSFACSLGTTRATARTNPRLARAFTSPLDGPSSSARARVPRAPPRDPRAVSVQPCPAPGRRRPKIAFSRDFATLFALFLEILRRFFALSPETSRRFFALYRTLSRDHAIRVEIFFIRVSSRADWLTVCA